MMHYFARVGSVNIGDMYIHSKLLSNKPGGQFVDTMCSHEIRPATSQCHMIPEVLNPPCKWHSHDIIH